MVDDHKKEFHLLESQLLTATDTIAKLQLEFQVDLNLTNNPQEADLQRSHWEQMVRCDVERTMQREKEYQEMKEGYKELYIYYMDVKADKERLQRQVHTHIRVYYSVNIWHRMQNWHVLPY